MNWELTEELDSIQCPFCEGYNRLSIAPDESHVYCAECGLKVSDQWLLKNGFELKGAIETARRFKVG